MLWSATSVLAFILLIYAILFYSRINTLLFFSKSSVLYFGTLSQYYYLLPLLFLPKILNSTDKWQQLFKIIIYWAIGFVVGYMVMQLTIYIDFHQFMQIDEWCNPNKVSSIGDLYYNIQVSFLHAIYNLKHIFSNTITNIIIVLIFCIGLWQVTIKKYLICMFLFIAIMYANFIIILPIGVNIDERTLIATWI